MLAAKRPLMRAERLKMLAAKLPQRCSKRCWHKGTTAERASRLLRAGWHVRSETLLVGCLAQDLRGRINEANLIDEGERIKVQAVSTQQVSSTKAVVSMCRPYGRNRSYQKKRPCQSAGRIDAACFIDDGRRIKVQVVSTSFARKLD